MFEALACWWCEYLKNITTLTTKRKLFFLNGPNSTSPVVKELVICPECDNEHPINVIDQIKLIVTHKPELKDWLTLNPIYNPEK